MMKMVTHTEARSLEILKLKNLFEKSSNPPQVNQFVIHQNLEHDALTVSNWLEVEWSQLRSATSS